MAEESAGKQIDKIIQLHGGWKAEILTNLRSIILQSDSDIYEEVKWKMPTRPEGLPVWIYNGIVCFAEIWKDNVKLIFNSGAKLTDAHRLFNSRLNSSSVRAIELHYNDVLDTAALTDLVREAVEFNRSKAAK